jgi:hypothetical protein
MLQLESRELRKQAKKLQAQCDADARDQCDLVGLSTPV